MQILSNILAFLVAAGAVIFVHELGHYLVGRLFGVRVLVFSLGFGQRIWGFRRGDTDYRVSLIPLGGYVSFDGQDPSQQSDDPGSFGNHPRWQRILIYLAGPAMNAVLAVLLVAVVFMMGTDYSNQRDVSAEVGFVRPESAAAVAGLQPGDVITAIDGEAVNDWQAVSLAVVTSPDQEMEVEYLRGSERLATTLTPEIIPRYELGEAGLWPAAPVRVRSVIKDRPADRAGLRFGDRLVAVDGVEVSDAEEFRALVAPRAGEQIELTIERVDTLRTVSLVPEEMDGRGVIGIYPDHFIFQRLAPVEAFRQSVRYNRDTVLEMGAFLGKVFERRISAKSALGGPVEIARISGAAARRGARDLIFFIALISLNLGLINMLPIPILDGGQISILLVESTLRRDLSLALKERIIQVGLVMILLLMVMVFYFDLLKSWPTT